MAGTPAPQPPARMLNYRRLNGPGRRRGRWVRAVGLMGSLMLVVAGLALLLVALLLHA